MLSTLSLCDSSNGILGSISEKPPTHYILKIDSFSLLLKNSVERYESREFEAGGYRWNLVLYPNGNKNRDVKEHLSLYLAMAASNHLQEGWEVYAVVRLFIFDQKNDNYMILQDSNENEIHFHGPKREWGFDQFLPLKALNNARNGFLVDDTCFFGADVFVCRERVKDQGECLRMIKDPISYDPIFFVYNFSKLGDGAIALKEFIAGDQKWTLKIWPKGKDSGLGTHLSVYLALLDPTNLTPGAKIFVEYTIAVINQKDKNHVIIEARDWFSTRSDLHGRPRFMKLTDFKSSFLLNDSCTIMAWVIVHGIVDDL